MIAGDGIDCHAVPPRPIMKALAQCAIALVIAFASISLAGCMKSLPVTSALTDAGNITHM